MYQSGDMIIYGSNGVCRVVEVGKPNASVDQSKLYYTLRPLYSSEVIYTPVDTSVFMRPVISHEEADRLISQIPYIQADVCDNHNLVLLSAHYQESLQSHDCQELIRLVRSVYAKNQSASQAGKKLGQLDQRYLKRAEELLHGELAVALEIPIDEVVGYITSAVSSIEES